MSLSDLEFKQNAVLQRIQWCVEDISTHPPTRYCPICQGMQPLHAPDCELWGCLAAGISFKPDR